VLPSLLKVVLFIVQRHTLATTPDFSSKLEVWLEKNKPQLAQLAAEIIPLNQIGDWFESLRPSTPEQPVDNLNGLTLSPAQIAALFSQMAAQTTDPTILKALFSLQTAILSVQAPLIASPNWVEHLAALNKKLAEIDVIEQFPAKAVQAIAETLDLSSVNLFFITGKEKTLTLRAAQWRGKIPSSEDMARLQTEINQQPNLIQAVRESGLPQQGQAPPYPLPDAMGNVGAEMAAPLICNNRLVGVLHRFESPADRPASNQLAGLTVVAQYLAAAIEKIQSKASIRRLKREQHVLAETSRVLKGDGPPQKKLTVLAQKISEIFNAQACTLIRWQSDDQSLTANAEYIRPLAGVPKHTWRKPNTSIPLKHDSIARQVLQTMRPLATSAQTADQTPRWAAPGWKHLLAFPMAYKGQKLGLIEVYSNDDKKTFTLEDVQLSKLLTIQAAIAINQLELLGQTQQRLAEVSTLYTLSQQIISTSSFNLTQLLDNVVYTMKEIADCRACVLFLLDDTGKYLQIQAAAGLKRRWKKNARLAVGEGAAGQAALHKKSVYIPDTTKDPSFIFFDKAVRSLLVVPMIFQDKVVGTINLDDSKPNAFGSSQERLLSIAANYTAVAIENATLFHQVSSEEQRMRAIIQHMADGILMIDKAGVIVKVNPVMSLILGLHPANIIDKNINDKHLHPRLRAICAPLTAKQRTGILTNEVTLPGKPPIIVRIFATMVTNEHKESLGEVRVVHDVTQERELERLKDDFVSTISHELRTPLFSIQGFVRLILEGDVPNPHTQREFLTIIERQANQLSDLVSNLLDLNRLSNNVLSIDMQPMQVVKIVHQTILKLQGFAHKKKVNLTSQLPSSLPLIEGDEQRLEQVITNLVGNAIKFTPVNGNVLVKAQHVKSNIIISVTDTGIGIAPKDLEKIFQKFYQVEEHSTRSAEGSGLGLHISRQLVEKHHGKIWAKSAIGKGSTFFVQLPVKKNN